MGELCHVMETKRDDTILSVPQKHRKILNWRSLRRECAAHHSQLLTHERKE